MPGGSAARARPVAQPVEELATLGEHRAAGLLGLAETRELAQRGLAAQRIHQQKHLPRVLAVAHQAAHRADGGDWVEAGAGGLRHSLILD